MGLTKVAMKPLNYIFQALGIMPKSQIHLKCRNLGINIADSIRGSNGRLSPEQFRSIFESTISPKRMSKIDLCLTKEEFVSQMTKKGFSVSEAESLYNNSAGGVYFGKRPLVNLPIDRWTSMNLVDTVTHESQHALSSAFSIKEKLFRFMNKIGINLEKHELEHSEIQALEQQFMKFLGRFQTTTMGSISGKKGLEGLLERSKFANETELLQCIQREIYYAAKLDQNMPRKNLKKLLNLKRFFEEEYRSYKVGGEAANYWLKDSKIKVIPKSEAITDIYAEVLKVINSEIRTALKDRIVHIM